jgi:gliding motility-associated-like protein
VHTGGQNGTYNAMGEISASQNGKKLVCAIYNIDYELFDFNNSTGVLSNLINISGYPNAWGTEFSPDGTKLYTTQWTYSGIYQFDLSSNNQTTINSSATVIGTATSPDPNYKAGYLQLGPDQKIYVAKFTSGYVGVIDSPNLLGTLCNYIDNGVSLGGKFSEAGFPSFMQTNCSPIIATISSNSTICVGSNVSLSASGGTNYTWSTGATTSVILSSPIITTTYSVIVSGSCGSDTASATVTVSPPPVAVVTSATICSGQNATLTASGGGNYSWNNSSTASSITVSPTITSTYSVVVSNGSCSDTTSAIVIINPNPTANVSGSISIHQGQTTTLTTSGGTNYLWNNGETTTVISVAPTVTTIYCVTITDTNNCTDTACTKVYVESPCDTAGIFFFPNAFSPNSDDENDVLKIYYHNMNCIKTFTLNIYDRWGEQVFETTDKTFQWDGIYQNKILNTQVLTYYLSVVFTDSKAMNKKGNISLLR